MVKNKENFYLEEGKKKEEFPDALALYALEQRANELETGFLIVSKDGDWKAFCDLSRNLYHVSEIERALALISSAPIDLREAIRRWFALGGEGRDRVKPQLAAEAECLEFTAYAHPSYGEVESTAWAGQLKDIGWPDEADFDIMEIEAIDENNTTRVIVSFLLNLSVMIPVELSFSVWDSVDRESVSMGGRSVEIEKVLDVRSTFTLTIFQQVSGGTLIELEEAIIEERFHEIDIGEVDVFERQEHLN